MNKRKFKKSKVLVLIAIASLVVVSASGIASNSNLNASEIAQSESCQVTDSEVISYLEGQGYSNITLKLTPRVWGCDRLADTDYSYDTRVFCTETEIIGHEDMPD